jgi:hypothetical protein
MHNGDAEVADLIGEYLQTFKKKREGRVGGGALLLSNFIF